MADFAILLKLVNIWAAAESLASWGKEHGLPSHEFSKSNPLTLTLAWNLPSKM